MNNRVSVSHIGGDVHVFTLMKDGVHHSNVASLGRRVDAPRTTLVWHVKRHT